MPNEQTITLAGGCFWCLEAVFEQLPGVRGVESGYANGQSDRPRYEQVCQGDTGHAEVVRLRFDADRIALRALLEVFYSVHDATTLNRQGHDVGTQYRSGIYWDDPAHEAEVRAVTAEVNAATGGRVVTELAPLRCYWPAEAYHQHYFAQHPGQGYCVHVVAPKVASFKHRFSGLLKG